MATTSWHCYAGKLARSLKSIQNSSIHCIALAFVPDEEITTGAALHALHGYTIDGGPFGEFCYETFNAAEVSQCAHGLSFTGTAKAR